MRTVLCLAAMFRPLARSAGFRACRIADFLVCERSRRAGYGYLLTRLPTESRRYGRLESLRYGLWLVRSKIVELRFIERVTALPCPRDSNQYSQS
jgi:hypothetical protein